MKDENVLVWLVFYVLNSVIKRTMNFFVLYYIMFYHTILARQKLILYFRVERMENKASLSEKQNY